MCRVLFCHHHRNLIAVSGFAIAPLMTKLYASRKALMPLALAHVSGQFWKPISLATSAACFGKASRTAAIIGVYINGGSEKAEKLG
jgi:hypothetical protein